MAGKAAWSMVTDACSGILSKPVIGQPSNRVALQAECPQTVPRTRHQQELQLVKAVNEVVCQCQCHQAGKLLKALQ